MPLPLLEKTCTSCKQTKPTSEFFKHRSSKDGMTSQCKLCITKHQKAFYQANRERINKRNRHCHRLQRYGISPSTYIKTREIQNGLCPICDKPLPNYRLTHVDHNHTNGKVRALLCCPCNAGIGCFHDDPILIGKAIQYLERFIAATTNQTVPKGVNALYDSEHSR